MAFPQVVSSVPFVLSAPNVQVPMPATVNADDLLMVDIGTFQSSDGTANTPAGWSLLANSTPGANKTGYWFWREADGSEGGSTVTFVMPLFGGSGVGTVRRITGWDPATPPEAAVLAVAASANPNGGALAPSWGAEDNLWITAYFQQTTGAATVYPTNYTDGQTANTWGEAYRELNSATENPGAFTTDSAGAWWAITMAVRPGSAPIPPATGGNRIGGTGAIRKPPRNR